MTKCVNCVHFEPIKKDDYTPVKQGHCVYNPPTVVTPAMTSFETSYGLVVGGGWETVFPVVDRNMRCGKFQSKEV